MTPETMNDYLKAGANSFGLGSSLFTPDLDLGEIANRARNFIHTYREITGT